MSTTGGLCVLGSHGLWNDAMLRPCMVSKQIQIDICIRGKKNFVLDGEIKRDMFAALMAQVF